MGTVALEYDEDCGLEEEFKVDAKTLEYGQPGQIYIRCRREPDCTEANLDATLSFTIKDSTVENPEFEQGYEDEYDLNAVDLLERDFVAGKVYNREDWGKGYEGFVDNEVLLKQ